MFFSLKKLYTLSFTEKYYLHIIMYIFVDLVDTNRMLRKEYLMKSICIKLTSKKTTEYLLDHINKLKIDNIYFSCKKFKVYYNIIVHYKGNNKNLFLKEYSKLLTTFIINFFEEKIIKNLIKSEYFYFDEIEQLRVLNIVLQDLYDKSEALTLPKEREKLIYEKIYKYILSNHSIILKGFISFRLKEYFDSLLEQIDKSVNKYIVEKEYSEFISILKLYVNSEVSSCNYVHLIYNNSKPILLDENKSVINVEESMLNKKYLSDISFSSNDYVLNTLLNLIPKKINIHLIDENIDEFINTIKLIFEDRVNFCTECSLCNKYKKSHAIHS